VKYQKYAEKIIEKYLTENEEEFGFLPMFGGLMISARGIPRMIMESEDSTMLLDMDETLVHATKLAPSLLKLLNADSRIVTSGKPFDSKDDVKPYAEAHLQEFKDAVEGYKYKDSVTIVEHRVFGHQLLVFRPLLKEFLDELEKLVGSKDLKDVLVYSANASWWVDTLVKAVNKYTGKKLKPHVKGDKYHVDSMIADDSWNSAKIKLLGTKVITPAEYNGGSNRWVQVEEFRGNLDDKELKNTIQEIKNRV